MFNINKNKTEKEFDSLIKFSLPVKIPFHMLLVTYGTCQDSSTSLPLQRLLLSVQGPGFMLYSPAVFHAVIVSGIAILYAAQPEATTILALRVTCVPAGFVFVIAVLEAMHFESHAFVPRI